MSQEPQFTNSELFSHWLVCGFFLIILISYNVVCHIWGENIQLNWEVSDRILIKSFFYAFTIILFPIVKLLRYILLRLNKTMPGNEKFARQRYFFTVTVTVTLIELVGTLGFIMFLLGDNLSTLYIFSGLSALGLFLHRPRLDEYIQIWEALHTKN